METLRVGIKYCGNCNPRIDGPALVRALRGSMPDTEFLSFKDPDQDVLLVVSACASDCATRLQPFGPEVSVAGRSVNRVFFEETELAREVMRVLESYRPDSGGNISGLA